MKTAWAGQISVSNHVASLPMVRDVSKQDYMGLPIVPLIPLNARRD
jgi:hypothetical protein